MKTFYDVMEGQAIPVKTSFEDTQYYTVVVKQEPPGYYEMYLRHPKIPNLNFWCQVPVDASAAVFDKHTIYASKEAINEKPNKDFDKKATRSRKKSE